MIKIDLWNVARELQKPKGNTRYSKVPQGHVNLVLSWSFRAI
jgi:hypothetical protein